MLLLTSILAVVDEINPSFARKNSPTPAPSQMTIISLTLHNWSVSEVTA